MTEETSTSDNTLRYREIAPPPELAPTIRSLWEISGNGLASAQMVSRILPDGCIDLVFHLGDLATAAGPDAVAAKPQRSYLVGTILRSRLVQFAKRVHVVGVCLQPGTAAPTLGFPAQLLADRVVPLRDVSEFSAASLEDELGSGPPELALARLGCAMLRRQHGRLRHDAVAAAGVQRICSSIGKVSVDALAMELGLSRRGLERRFATQVGLSPKLFCRVTRFDHAARRLRVGRNGTSWAEFAAEHGYFDQAHFIREFREFAGVTPGEFEAEQRRVASVQYAAPKAP